MSKKTSKPAPSRSATPQSVVDAIQTAIAAVRELTDRRREEKLSIARLMGVSRELKELVKVMSVYGV
jgi:hypothetical protein